MFLQRVSYSLFIVLTPSSYSADFGLHVDSSCECLLAAPPRRASHVDGTPTSERLKEILALKMVKVVCRKRAQFFIVANPGSCGSRTLWAAILAGVPLLSAKAFVDTAGSVITHSPAINTQRQASSWSYLVGAGISRVDPEPSPGHRIKLES